MATIPEALTRSRVYQRVAIGILAVFIAMAGLIIGWGYYYNRLSNQSPTPLNRPVDSEQLAAAYQNQAKTIINSYLNEAPSGIDIMNNDFLLKTNRSQEQLLALTVPPVYKDFHLAAVLIFIAINREINAANLEATSNQISNLEQLLANF